MRVKVQAAGFTIAPLLPQYTVHGESQESLVTLVLKADMGGLLSAESLGGRLMSPLVGHAMRGMLEPVVASIVVLRDRVEQNRFVIRPLAVASDVSEPKEERGKMERAATMLGYKHHNLALNQEEAAERRPAAEFLVLDARQPSVRKPTLSESAGAEITALGEEGVETRAEFGGEREGVISDAWAITGTCDKKYWLSPGNCGLKVRGPDYLTDRKKVLAAPPMFELVAVDLLELEEPMFHVCKHLPSVKYSPAPFMFCVQMMVPSSPPVSLVCTWGAPMEMMGVDPNILIEQFEQEQGPCPENVSSFFRAFTEFLEGDGPEADKYRNSRFKLIPNISQGSWIIKQSVGTTPVILGQKLRTKYFRGEKYFEVDVDIGASSVAASITNLVCGATKSLAVDLGVLIEGQTSETLPEQLVGTIRLDKLDLKTASYFDESTGRVCRPEAFQPNK